MAVGVAVHGTTTIAMGITNIFSPIKYAHGNSKSSHKPQHGYAIYDSKTKDTEKYGVSGSKLNQDGSSKRANNQVNKLNKAAGYARFFAQVLKSNVPTRAQILNWEKGKVRAFKKASPIKAQPNSNKLPKIDN